MPYTEAQRGLFKADLGRLGKGQKTATGMNKDQLVKALGEGTRPSGSVTVKKATYTPPKVGAPHHKPRFEEPSIRGFLGDLADRFTGRRGGGRMAGGTR